MLNLNRGQAVVQVRDKGSRTVRGGYEEDTRRGQAENKWRTNWDIEGTNRNKPKEGKM
jgi:hypothetical protein